jgi:hypothetical protein
VALLGYRVNQQFELERLGKLLSWSSGTAQQPSGAVFLTYPAATTAVPKPTPLPQSLLQNNWPAAIGAAPTYNGTDTDFHVVADQVCRLEFCFLLKNGTYVCDPAGGTATDIHSLKDVRAIIVSLVVLDAASQKITDIAKVSAAFSDPTTADLTSNPPVLMAQKWREQLYSGNFSQASGIPQAAAAQIRIYERHFYLVQP